MKIIFNEKQAQEKYNKKFKPMQNVINGFTIFCAVTALLSAFIFNSGELYISLAIAAIGAVFAVIVVIILCFYIEKIDTATDYYSYIDDSKVLDTKLSLIGFNAKTRKVIVEITITLETKKGKTKEQSFHFEGTCKIKDIAGFEVDLDNEVVYFPRNLEESSLCQM